MTNDKIPTEIHEDILLSAKAFAAGTWSGISKHDAKQREYVERVYIAGATSWAKKRHDLKVILQEFVSNHEAGLLPNRFVYEKAIKILNDGK